MTMIRQPDSSDLPTATQNSQARCARDAEARRKRPLGTPAVRRAFEKGGRPRDALARPRPFPFLHGRGEMGLPRRCVAVFCVLLRCALPARLRILRRCWNGGRSLTKSPRRARAARSPTFCARPPGAPATRSGPAAATATSSASRGRFAAPPPSRSDMTPRATRDRGRSPSR
jgi:hypothetical protein